MSTLDTVLRNLLSRSILNARVKAEQGARQALEALAVERRAPHGSMTDQESALRNRLRAHGRQLGDQRDKEKGTQGISRLVREVAYEHWHRMLFARFLAENGLLIEPASGVAITMDECEELARERAVDSWALASSFAQGMLPRIFRPDDPALAVVLPPETRLALQKLLADLPPVVFTADDSLGWTYQFWQAAEKEAVNRRVKSGEKITGETLPAVTQLFTEHYMVQFLLHNTLGAWHAGKALATAQRESAGSEGELREACRLSAAGGYDFEYLRFVRDPKEGESLEDRSGPWRPAGGVFEGWPRRAAEVTVLDPCCGSGHFLVAAFDLLVRLRMEEEGLPLEEAIRAVIRDNLFGLELDPRCTQIAAFNLALAAWRMAGAVIDLPPMRIACSGIGPQGTREEWVAMAERSGAAWSALKDEEKARIRAGLLRLYGIFAKAPELGSLIDPTEGEADLFTAGYDEVGPFLQAAFDAESLGDEDRERAVAARGMADAAAILLGRSMFKGAHYTLVSTNVPFRGRNDLSAELRAWGDSKYKDAKHNLATIFVARLAKFVRPLAAATGGTIAVVAPWDWLFLTSYERIRRSLLKDASWEFEARLGTKAFEAISGEVVGVSLVAISGGSPQDSHVVSGLSVELQKSSTEKAAGLSGHAKVRTTLTEDPFNTDGCSGVREPGTTAFLNSSADLGASDAYGEIVLRRQADQLLNPNARINFQRQSGLPYLSEFAECLQGISTGDYDRFGRRFWEMVFDARGGWLTQQNAVDSTAEYRGREWLVAWNEVQAWARSGGAAIRGGKAWGRPGVALSQVADLPSTLFGGDAFADSCPVIIPRDPRNLVAIWCFCRSPRFREAVRSANPKLSVNNGYLGKIPFDLGGWRTVGEEQYPDGLPEPESDDATQWLFHGHPARATESTVLQVAVARLLGYRWPPELDSSMRLSRRARALVDECESLAACADGDGIVCLSSVRGEGSAADRLRSLLAAAYEGDWSATKEQDLLRAAAERFDRRGTPAATLDGWLRDRFFEEHCAMFHKRPFVLHIWDGRGDGFNALVNYHKLAGPDGEGLRTLNALTYTYLGEWIDRQRAEQKAGVEGSDGRLAAAIRLQVELARIIEGEPPCDIFVRWKPLHEQPVGWAPDINDGVRLNLRPFLSTIDLGPRAAGVLRVKPDDTWSNSRKVGVSDRGKEPEKLRPREDYPWFWGCSPEQRADHQTDFGAPTADAPSALTKFDGIRWNNLHYTRAAKELARTRRSGSAS